MENTDLHVPARQIPVPEALSEEARACLAMGPLPTTAEWPPLDDSEAWRTRIAWQDENLLAIVGAASTEGVSIENLDVDGVRVYAVTPDGAGADRRVYLDIHGGALIMGGGECCRALAMGAARRFGVTTWAVDYRMPPDHPYPAPLYDCVAVYKALLRDHRPEDIIVGGGSAGANLAAALILRARDEGSPLPAAALLMSPEIDLTESGDTFQTNLGVDTVIGSFLPVNLMYANGHDLADPYLSPLFGDFSKGFPPTLLTAGTARSVPLERSANAPSSSTSGGGCRAARPRGSTTRRFLRALAGRNRTMGRHRAVCRGAVARPDRALTLAALNDDELSESMRRRIPSRATQVA